MRIQNGYMAKWLNGLIISIILLMGVVVPVGAQRVVEDFVYQYEKWGEVYDKFTTSRDKYKKYDVLSAREEAIKDTNALILKRNQVLRTWFLALKHKLRNTTGVLESGNSLMAELDKKVIWLEEQNDEVNNLQTPDFEDLFVLSDRVEDRQVELMRLGYQSLGEVLLGKIRTLNSESVSLTTLISEEISSSENATKAAQLDLWIKEVRVKNYLAGKEIEAAETNLWNLKGARRLNEIRKHFVNLKIDINDTKLYLEQALSYQKEILGELE